GRGSHPSKAAGGHNWYGDIQPQATPFYGRQPPFIMAEW
ncbi:unnamed protein product, partial [marine sediment metagenome]